MHLFSYSDLISPEIIQSFEQQYQCTVLIDIFDSNESMYSKIKTGSTGYDLVFPTEYMVSLMSHEGLLEIMDRSQIPNFKNLDMEILENLNFKLSPYALPYLVTFTGIAWNENRVHLDLPSWNLFSEAKYRGRMTMLNDIRETIGAALIYLGYSINTIDISEINEAKNLLIRWKKNLAKFENEQYKIGLATNEYFISHAFSSDIAQLNEEFPNIHFAIPKEGGVINLEMVAMLHGSSQKELAYAFINFLYDAQHAAKNIEQTKALAPIKEVKDYLPLDYQQNEIIFPNEESLKRCQIIQDIGDAILLYNRTWDQIKIDD